VIFGMVTSTALTLLVVPVVYSIVERRHLKAPSNSREEQATNIEAAERDEPSA